MGDRLIMTKKSSKQNERGQALLFVIVAMTVVLALGVGISMDTLTSITTVSNTDTSQRALAAAEGGVEKFLTLDSEQLKLLSDIYTTGNDNDWQTICQSTANVNGEGGGNKGCRVEYKNSNVANDPIQAKAVVVVEEYRSNTRDSNGARSNGVKLNIRRNDAGEVNVRGISNHLNVCWNPVNEVDLYMTVLDDAGNAVKSFARCASGYCSGWTFSSSIPALSTSPSQQAGYTRCVTLNRNSNMPAVPTYLRIRPLFKLNPSKQNADVAVFPNDSASTLPAQGYKITSTGSLIENNTVTVTRTVTVYKSNPMPIGLFDFSIYAGDELKSIL